MKTKPTFSFAPSYDVAGVEVAEISADYDRESFLTSGLRSAPAIIRVAGRAAIADAVLRNLGAIYSSREPLDGVRFGPRGRRNYRFVSEEIVDRIVEHNVSLESISYKRRPAREIERSDAIAEFATDLIDLI